VSFLPEMTATGTSPPVRVDLASRSIDVGRGDTPAALENGPGLLPRTADACPSARGFSGSCASGEAFPADGAVSVLGFQNSTISPTAPPATELGSLAWDAAEDEAVYFGGWTGSTASSATWIFHAGIWTQATTAGPGPSARYGAAMAYDGEPGVDAIVLFGGCDPTGACPMSDTWLFSAGVWENVTSAIGPMPGLFNASMSSWGASGAILYGGCTAVGCSGQSGTTWAFENSSSCQSAYHEPCWTDLAIPNPNPPGLAGAALADNPLVGTYGSIVLYGGYNSSCPSCAGHDENATWLFNGVTWDNVTALFYGGYAYPSAGRALAALFWDPNSEELYLYGGVDNATGQVFDQLWELDLNDSSWFNESTLPLPSEALYGPAVASGLASPALSTVLVGGRNASAGIGEATYVFERSMVTHLHVTPVPVETNVTVRLYSNTTGGSAPLGTWTMGDGESVTGNNATYVYHRPGTFAGMLTVTDAYGVRVASHFSNRAFLFDPGLSAPVAADQGFPSPFGSTPVNGTAPYNYTWTFSDGTVASGGNVTHAFATVGNASVLLSVRDDTGTIVNASASFPVRSTLSAVVAAAPTALTLGATTTLSIAGQGGSPPYRATWTLPDNRTVVALNTPYRPTTPGAEIVAVVLTDIAGATWRSNLTLTVNPALTFTASWASAGPTSGRTIHFTTAISGGTSPYTYAWQFGDGSSSSLADPTHTYASAGTFTVFAWVNDSGGGSYRQTLEVKVPRTSGGLLWQVFDFPLYEQLALWVAVAVVIALLAFVAYRRVQRGREPPSPAASPPPAALPPKS